MTVTQDNYSQAVTIILVALITVIFLWSVNVKISSRRLVSHPSFNVLAILFVSATLVHKIGHSILYSGILIRENTKIK